MENSPLPPFESISLIDIDSDAKTITNGYHLLNWKDIRFHLPVLLSKSAKIDSSFFDRFIFNLVVLNPLDRSLKLEYRLDDNSSYISFYDLDINPSDTKREYVTFWNSLTNTNIYRQITRKHLHIETADIHHFNLIWD
ncbi:3121_t:CDS:2 [Funneliformis geosporum]|nr:3121_t:CDS:2 [Funneliformis geosporum]